MSVEGAAPEDSISHCIPAGGASVEIGGRTSTVTAAGQEVSHGDHLASSSNHLPNIGYTAALGVSCQLSEGVPAKVTLERNTRASASILEGQPVEARYQVASSPQGTRHRPA